MNAWKQHTEPLGGQFPSAPQNPCAAPGADQLADLTGPEARARLSLLLEDAPGLPGMCVLSADELEDLAPDLEPFSNPVPPSLEDLTARMNAGLKALALALSALSELLQVAREGREGGRS